MFYPDQKGYISPSAIAMWFDQKSAFIKIYFEGIKTPETSAMKGGKKIHALIEAGIIKSNNVFDLNEEPITEEIDWKGGKYKVYGIPDSREILSPENKNRVKFVDFKTGKENGWEKKLPSDMKMKATAWLVWRATGKPTHVIGIIEYIKTEWDKDAREVVAKEGIEAVSIKHIYDYAELDSFTISIAKAMDAINEEYEKWKESTTVFVSEDDMKEYAALKEQKDALDERMKEIGENIKAQLELGGKSTYKGNLGTFYLTERKSYKYPATLKVNYKDYGITLEDFEQIEASVAAAKKNYELENDPVSTSKNIGFRAPKK